MPSVPNIKTKKINIWDQNHQGIATPRNLELERRGVIIAPTTIP
jgi:hypothetical protein